MNARYKILCASLLVLVFCPAAPSDDKAPDKKARAVDKPADKNSKAIDKAPDKNAETVSKALASLAKAYNARDPKAFLAFSAQN